MVCIVVVSGVTNCGEMWCFCLYLFTFFSYSDIIDMKMDGVL